MGYIANPTPVLVDEDVRVQYAAQWNGNSRAGRWIKATTKVTRTEYRGLSANDSAAMLANASYNYVNKSDYAIGEYDGNHVLVWYLVAPNAAGTESHATRRRVGDTQIFTVTVTASTTTCSGSHAQVTP